ncbi:ABC transporter substrate-binding protein [Anaerobium acetethylicum]|uniref:Putative aldouronate transport system substrate-binding protein n=1 Tax=Anaerobium acetethylicum TaxID=1619234 RepID=A0A1D3TV35_9FIRM|nr:ABC transporter substrate-binding protein [Anaerobium acetethylicum]SCP98000.1 putative aldouronate transport system substrate-binding protein [Anaerobium acetethylicum]
MKRKLVSVLLTAAMVATMLVGCGESKTDNEAGKVGTEADQSDSAEVEKIKIYLPSAGKRDDMAKVMEAVNEISREKIGVEVEFKVYDFGQWFQQYSLFLSGTEDVDMLANYGGYLNAVSQGAAYDITDLIQEYGQDIIEMEGDYLKSGEINGVQYAVPIYASYAWNMGIIYRQDVVDELGLGEKVAQVKNLEDWEEILAAVKAAKPDMTPFVTNSGNTAPNFQYGFWDDLGNNYGVLMNGGETADVVNLFETEQYAQLCGVLNDWYNKGYSNKDIQTQTDAFTVLTQNEAAFSTIGQTDFNTAFYQSTSCGKNMGAILLDTPVARTYNNVTYTIMSNTEHAEACMKFMNLWFSDKEIGNLISYGIEGEHYQLNENGMGSYLDGQDASTCTYHLGSAISNTNRIRWESENPDYAEKLVESNSSAQKSAALGFSFDPTNVTNEITQLDNVCSKYQIGLESGALDPETYLPEFIAALKDAGLDTVIAEKQKQVDAFLAANK